MTLIYIFSFKPQYDDHYMKLAKYAERVCLYLDYDQVVNLVKNMKQKTNEKLRNLENPVSEMMMEVPNQLAKAQLTKSEEIIAKMINPSGNYSCSVLLTMITQIVKRISPLGTDPS